MRFGVLGQQPQQLNTGVTGSAYNAYFDHHYVLILCVLFVQ